jgi:hypothetical protein
LHCNLGIICTSGRAREQHGGVRDDALVINKKRKGASVETKREMCKYMTILAQVRVHEAIHGVGRENHKRASDDRYVGDGVYTNEGGV